MLFISVAWLTYQTWYQIMMAADFKKNEGLVFVLVKIIV